MNRIKREKDEFVANLNSIKNFIEIDKELSDMVSYNCFDTLNHVNIDLEEFKKKYLSVAVTPVTYNAIIISIYGCFEAYIDRISNLLLDFWTANACSYDQICKEIRDKHLKKCGEFLSNPQRYKNMGITENDVVRKINTCLSNDLQFELNKELILRHGGNLKISQLMEFLHGLGLKDCKNKIVKSKHYIDYFANKHELNPEEAEKMISDRIDDEKILFKALDELVEQRNKVAHGWSVEDRLSKEYLIDEIIPFTKMLGCVISELFINEFAEILRTTDSLMRFDDVIEIYNNKIICINSKTSHLKQNDYIFANNGKQFLALNIVEIQKDKQRIEEVLEDNVNIGLKVDLNVKKNWEFYYK